MKQLLGIFASLLAMSPVVLAVCPDCISERATLAEEIEAADAAVLARLVTPAPPFNYGPDELGEFGAIDPDAGKATFAVVDRLRGSDVLVGIDEFQAVFFGEPKKDDLYLVTALADPLEWAIPIPVSPAAAEYIRKLDDLPAAGTDRLRFFLQYLQHPDTLLALDAYEEFARAPYEEVTPLEQELDRDQLRQWIVDPQVNANRRSLYFVLLGICGEQEDIAWLEQMISADRRRLVLGTEAAAATALACGGGPALVATGEAVAMELNRSKNGLRAMIGCYLKLRGAEGLDLVDEQIFHDRLVDTSEMHSALMALRTAAEETMSVPQERINQSMRLALGYPDFADQAITDLARWEDWSVTERLIDMFRAPDQNAWTRQSIVAYLDLAAEQPGEVGEMATAAVTEFEQLDPKAVKNARTLATFGFLAGAMGAPRDDGKTIPPNAVRPKPIDTASDLTTLPIDDDPSALPEQRAAGGGEVDRGEDRAGEETFAEVADVGPAGDSPESDSPEGVAKESNASSAGPEAMPGIDDAETAEAMAADAATTDQEKVVADQRHSGTSRSAAEAQDVADTGDTPPSMATLVGLPLAGFASLVFLFYFVMRGGI